MTKTALVFLEEPAAAAMCASRWTGSPRSTTRSAAARPSPRPRPTLQEPALEEWRRRYPHFPRVLT
ncbi:hypothetical protein ACWDAO_20085 [Streptomyces sp. NPDC001212]